MTVLEFNHVWKKYRRGEKFNSIRDSVPAFFKNMFKKNEPEAGLDDLEFWVIQDVSFQIQKGEVVGIMGPNGAGKSTILKLLSRIIVPNQGTLQINGKLSALIEVTAGFHPELTGRENVYLNGTILGMRKKEIDAKFNEIVEFSGITEFIDTPVKRYSSGMYSRLGFSVAAHMDPEILLVDEVLAVGDIAFQAKCAEKMRALLSSGATIVLVSHQLPLIQSLCKRVILLNKGQVIKDGSTNQVIPFYENIVLKQQEDDFKRKIKKAEYKVSLSDQSAVMINKVMVKSSSNELKEKFKPNDAVSIEVHYQMSRPIEQPIFAMEIIRFDGVLCCYSDTRGAGLAVENLSGEGSYKMNLKQLRLGAGVYMLKISVWDKDLIHPYAIRNQDILRIEADGLMRSVHPVYIPEVSWELKGTQL